MKVILIFFLLVQIQIFGQTIKRDYHMDSIARSNINSCLIGSSSDDVKTIMVSKVVKFTFKTYVQTNLFVDLIDGDMEMDDVDIDDVIGIGKYDIRMKVYLSHHVRVISRLVVTGVNNQNNSYSCGFILKF